MNNIYFSLALLFIFLSDIYCQKPEETEDWSRKPDIVTPSSGNKPPSDAIVLYSKKQDIVNWTHSKGEPVKWKAGKCLTVVKKSGAIQTVESFGSVQLHVEWKAPKKIEGSGQGRGNSGVFLMSRYEVQVLDSYDNETYYNGQAGSIYKQHIPLVNASKPPGKWQVYDIFLLAPKFNDDKTLKSPAYITVIHNGILIQNHVELKGPTRFIGQPSYEFHVDKMPLMLQDHSNPVSFRNIWIRELK